MQKINQTDALSLSPQLIPPQSAPADYPQDGDFCDTTRRIMIISPWPASLHNLVGELTIRCYDVLLFHHADDSALSLLQGDLLLLDQTRGRMTGEEIQQLRARDIPMLSLVSEGTPSSQVGSDFIVWPSSMEVLVDRIQSFDAPSSRPVFGGTDQLQHKDIRMDLKRMTVSLGDVRIDLTKTEFDLLKVLLSADGSVLSRQTMMDLVWGDQYFGGSNTVDAHIKSLRHKLGDDPKQPQYIVTVRGVGYRLTD
ncbi:DNA-binding response regulator, OmpR family, contains REC and winged-helix (wHTH) domain [Paenibacillus sp. 1_12]|uniref:winged helix-turn-helix domain-containing protein n=1 Tax=Paenibacillus sp. 1_12 TaxID=1566278 RepID=UPI0008E1EEDA|nr:winged helix-turn-helix domain-containing protein [Paenibacillus sp. 1_12]SFL94836.1 DNA-binding response regulator, OmpR family, contains REC and winged-helix (wHTH) domain [Paenibacillus sp. 1_12]